MATSNHALPEAADVGMVHATAAGGIPAHGFALLMTPTAQMTPHAFYYVPAHVVAAWQQQAKFAPAAMGMPLDGLIGPLDAATTSAPMPQQHFAAAALPFQACQFDMTSLPQYWGAEYFPEIVEAAAPAIESAPEPAPEPAPGNEYAAAAGSAPGHLPKIKLRMVLPPHTSPANVPLEPVEELSEDNASLYSMTASLATSCFDHDVASLSIHGGGGLDDMEFCSSLPPQHQPGEEAWIPAMDTMDTMQHYELPSSQDVPENSLFCPSCFSVLSEFSRRWEATPANYALLMELMCQSCLPILASLPLASKPPQQMMGMQPPQQQPALQTIHERHDDVSSLAVPVDPQEAAPTTTVATSEESLAGLAPSAFRNAFQFALALKGDDAFLPTAPTPYTAPGMAGGLHDDLGPYARAHDEHLWKTPASSSDMKLLDESAMSWKFSSLQPLGCALCRGSSGHPIRTRVPCTCRDGSVKSVFTAVSPLFGALGRISALSSPRIQGASAASARARTRTGFGYETPMFGFGGHSRRCSTRLPQPSGWSANPADRPRGAVGAVSHYLHQKSDLHGSPLLELGRLLKQGDQDQTAASSSGAWAADMKPVIAEDTSVDDQPPSELPHAPHPLCISGPAESTKAEAGSNVAPQVSPLLRSVHSTAALRDRAPKCVRPCRAFTRLLPSQRCVRPARAPRRAPAAAAAAAAALEAKRAELARHDSAMSLAEFVLTPEPLRLPFTDDAGCSGVPMPLPAPAGHCALGMASAASTAAAAAALSNLMGPVGPLPTAHSHAHCASSSSSSAAAGASTLSLAAAQPSASAALSIPWTGMDGAPSMYAHLTARGIPWCRFCGATTAPNWRPGPWGRKSLCNKHGCAWGGHSGSKRVRLDLSEYEHEPIESRLYPVIQEYCWQCQRKPAATDKRLHRCYGCQKAYHTKCLPPGTPRPCASFAAEENEPWYCSDECNMRTLESFVIGSELPPTANPLSSVSLPVTKRPSQKRKRTDAHPQTPAPPPPMPPPTTTTTGSTDMPPPPIAALQPPLPLAHPHNPVIKLECTF